MLCGCGRPVLCTVPSNAEAERVGASPPETVQLATPGIRVQVEPSAETSARAFSEGVRVKANFTSYEFIEISFEFS